VGLRTDAINRGKPFHSQGLVELQGLNDKNTYHILDAHTDKFGKPHKKDRWMLQRVYHKTSNNQSVKALNFQQDQKD
jgi:hypothetical protein